MAQSEMEQFRMQTKQDFVKLLDLLARVIDANKDVSTRDISNGGRLWNADALANKFIGHALTVLHLSYGTNVQSLPSFEKFSFIDTASIDVLTRAAMEAFLVFHYVFFAPSTTEEKEYRYWCYKAAGIAERQDIPSGIYEHEQQKETEKELLEEIRKKLESNIIFQNIRNEQKRQIFKGKEWKWKPHRGGKVTWREIAIDAGFSVMLASHMYRHLSGYAHSSSLSVLQSQQALINKEREQLIGASIGTINIVAANLIREYCGLFPRAQDVLSKDPEGNDIVEDWIDIGRRLGENLDTNTDKT